MFRKELESNLKKIFGVKKVTFDAPGESYEQDTMFVEIAQCRSRATAGKEISKVTGSLVIYSQHDKLPYGFFNKRINQADPALTKNLFLFEMDTDVANSPARLQNIAERRSRFIYLYSAQYDPDHGSMTSVQIEGNFNG